MRIRLTTILCLISFPSLAQLPEATSQAVPVSTITRNAQIPVPPVPPPSVPAVRPIPFSIGSSWVNDPVDTPDTIANSIPVVTTRPTTAPQPDIASSTNNQETAVVSPTLMTSIPPVIAPSIPTSNACGNGQLNLNDLLSPGCLAALKPMQPGGGASMTLTPTVATGVTCNVSIFATAGNANSVSFPSPDIRQCLEAGTRMSYGVPSKSNIIIVSSQGSIIGVTCSRKLETPSAIDCRQQS